MSTLDPIGDGGSSPGCTAHPTPLYTAEFAADPTTVYTTLRAQGPAAGVELAPGIPATLVTDYVAALEVLRDPVRFPKDPRAWQSTVPRTSPVLPMMVHRESCLFNDGAVHARLRGAVNDVLNTVDSTTLREYVEHGADTLIDVIAPRGEADLISQYTRLLPILVFDQLLDCPAHLSEPLCTSLATIFEGVDTGVEQANAELTRCAHELIGLRRNQPGRDVLSRLIAHPARLTTGELADTILLLLAAGIEPIQNLVGNALRLMLSDQRFAGGLAGGSLAIDDALVEILWTDPPLANYATTYPPQDVLLSSGSGLPGGRPVLISFAAANADPALTTAHAAGNRAHLAFSAGPHACPAQPQAMTISSVAIEKLLDRLPDLELAVPVETLTWRPGPFHRALTALPVRFPPAPTIASNDTSGDDAWSDSPIPTSSTPPAPTFTAKPLESGRGARRHWSNFLVRWWRGL